jgi:hypothetical protein
LESTHNTKSHYKLLNEKQQRFTKQQLATEVRLAFVSISKLSETFYCFTIQKQFSLRLQQKTSLAIKEFRWLSRNKREVNNRCMTCKVNQIFFFRIEIAARSLTLSDKVALEKKIVEFTSGSYKA